MNESVSSLGKSSPPPSAPSPPQKTVSVGGSSYSKTLPEKARTCIDNANALMKKLEESSVNSETTHALKEELFKTVCDLHQHLAESSLNKDVFEKIQREMENTIEACSNHLQPEKAGETHLALKTKLRANDVRFALQGLACAVPENLKTTFSDLVRKGESLESCIPLDTAISSEDLDGIQTRIDLFDTEVKGFEQSLVASLATDLGITEEVAKQIFEAAQQNWKPFIEEMPDGIIKQTHNIKKLKIYRMPGGRLVADFGIKDIGAGSSKRAKGMRRIGDTTIVRLASRTKEDTQVFEDDIATEMDAREQLIGVPNTTGITKIQYYNKNGVLKERYIMEKYETDLSGILQRGKADPSRALQCCADVFACLVAMHKLGLIHGDLKAANILCRGNSGFVNDFGFLSSKGTPLECIGSASYWAPETLADDPSVVWDPSMDMFSMGILLLEIADPLLYSLFFTETTSMQRPVERILAKEPPDSPLVRSKIKKMIGLYLKSHSLLQHHLEYKQTPLRNLIKSLTNYDPKKRPTAEQAKIAFDELIKSEIIS